MAPQGHHAAIARWNVIPSANGLTANPSYRGGANARMSVHQTDQERLATCRSNVLFPDKAFALIVFERPSQDSIPPITQQHRNRRQLVVR